MELKRETFKSEIERAKMDDAFLEELLLIVRPGRQVQHVREIASQTLMVLAEDSPERIKQYCDLFYDNLGGKNAFSKMTSIYCITGLVLADLEPNFSRQIKIFLAMLDDESVMVASHSALNAGKIAARFPAYEPEISSHFLKIAESAHKESRKDLVTAYILEAFSTFAAQSARFEQITAFVWRQMENPSPKARQAALRYLTLFNLK